MRLLHCGGFGEVERDVFKQIIYSSIVQNMTNLVMEAGKQDLKSVITLGLADDKFDVNIQKISNYLLI